MTPEVNRRCCQDASKAVLRFKIVGGRRWAEIFMKIASHRGYRLLGGSEEACHLLRGALEHPTTAMGATTGDQRAWRWGEDEWEEGRQLLGSKYKELSMK